jgi:hypothetical protein
MNERKHGGARLRTGVLLFVLIAVFLYARPNTVNAHSSLGAPAFRDAGVDTVPAVIAGWIGAVELDLESDQALYILFAVGVLGLIYRIFRAPYLTDEQRQSRVGPEHGVFPPEPRRT